MQFNENFENYAQEVIELRRHFHMNPELGFREYKTQEYIINYLSNIGLSPKKIAGTGVYANLKGDNNGPTLLMRADMDALAIDEQNECEYKSKNPGVMHACGHDAHIAMLLVAAKILFKHKDEICGNIKFVFQPNEEEAGAYLMVQEGILENPKVDAAMALHIWSPIESGKISVQEGPVMGAMDIFRLKIIGKGGHTALPHEAVNPTFVASQIINSCQYIQTSEIDVLNPTLICFAKINAGTLPNVIPDKAYLEGTIRYLYKGDDKSLEKPKVRFENMVSNICTTYNSKYELEIIPSNFVVENDTFLSNLVKSNAIELVGQENVVPYKTMAGEDFSEFTKDIPSTFYFLGSGNKDKATNYPHHHPRFNIDEDVLITGVIMHVLNAIKYLK